MEMRGAGLLVSGVQFSAWLRHKIADSSADRLASLHKAQTVILDALRSEHPVAEPGDEIDYHIPTLQTHLRHSCIGSDASQENASRDDYPKSNSSRSSARMKKGPSGKKLGGNGPSGKGAGGNRARAVNMLGSDILKLAAGWERTGLGERLPLRLISHGRGQLRLRLQTTWEKLSEHLELRTAVALTVLEVLAEKADAQGLQGVRLILFSVDDIVKALGNRLAATTQRLPSSTSKADRITTASQALQSDTPTATSLKATTDRITTAGQVLQSDTTTASALNTAADGITAVEQALLFLDEHRVIQMQGGLSLFRSAMTLRMKGGRKGRYTKADYEPLHKHYEQKVFQVHAIGRYVEQHRSGGNPAGYVRDYFRMTSERFHGKHFPDDAKALQRPVDADQHERIVTQLAHPEQERIVTAPRDRNMLILAGPGGRQDESRRAPGCVPADGGADTSPADSHDLLQPRSSARTPHPAA